MDFDSLKLAGGSLIGFQVPDRVATSPTRVGELVFANNTLMSSRLADTGLVWDLFDFTSLEEPSYLLPPGTVLYPFTSFRFTSPLAGDTRPSDAQFKAQAPYASSSFASNAQLFSTAAGIQTWTVPRDGLYEIAVQGARGASLSDAARPVSVGNVVGTFRLRVGDSLRMLVGQRTTRTQLNSAFSHPGGGGTFVESRHRGLLAVGGGSGGSVAGAALSNAVLANGTGAGGGSIGNGNPNGSPGSYGGGGYENDGQPPFPGTPNAYTRSFKNGGYNLGGGFGSGGMASNNSGDPVGGGGGYTGGSAGVAYNVAGGGSCFLSTLAASPTRTLVPINSTAANSVANGFVLVTYKGP